MVPCPHCGTPQSPNVKQCTACGGSLGVVPAADEPVRNLAQTQIAGSGPAPTPARPPAITAPALESPDSKAPQTGGTLKKTMLGMPSFQLPGVAPQTPSPAEPQPPAPRPHNKTQFGVGPLSEAAERPMQPLVQQPASEGGFKRTMLGVAPPEVLQQRMGVPAEGLPPPAGLPPAELPPPTHSSRPAPIPSPARLHGGGGHDSRPRLRRQHGDLRAG